VSNFNDPTIIAGDFNVIPEEIDSYAPEKYINDALFRIEIRKKYREIINLGLIDVFRNFNKKEGNYTFWDYMKGSWQKNNGLRIDHVLVSNLLIPSIKKIEIKSKIRSQIKPSDHVPLECTFF
jgi:exodeoxyribonuclease-3